MVVSGDTGWVDCAINGAGWTNAETVQIRNKGGVVSMRGAIHNATFAPNTIVTVGSVPAGFAPSRRHGVSASQNTAANLFLRVETSGSISAGWFVSTTATATASWYGFGAITYPLG